MGEQEQRKRGVAGLGRLAVSKAEAAESLGVSVDFFEDHVMHELRVVREGRRRLIPVSELVGRCPVRQEGARCGCSPWPPRAAAERLQISLRELVERLERRVQ